MNNKIRKYQIVVVGNSKGYHYAIQKRFYGYNDGLYYWEKIKTFNTKAEAEAELKRLEAEAQPEPSMPAWLDPVGVGPVEKPEDLLW